MPPAFGIAVVNSTLLKSPGSTIRAASTYERGIAAPAPAAARPGRRKKPELSVAPVANA
jgi:hypothetical protein